jgi:hypothetical protein
MPRAHRRLMLWRDLWACVGVLLLGVTGLGLAWAWTWPQLVQALTIHPDALLPQRDSAFSAADRVQPPPCPAP